MLMLLMLLLVGVLGTAEAKLEEKFFTQAVDHFAPCCSGHFQQRYFVAASSEFGKRSNKGKRTIFFYAGNEAPVTKYINSSGLIWENAEEFAALVVFAEHRYWGKSLIKSTAEAGNGENMRYLTFEQAMQDYVVLLQSLKANLTIEDVPVIAFGGSYGGMLAAWMRMTYPAVIFASVASSAPILAFPGISKFYDDGGASYWQVVTRNAGRKCAAKVYDALRTLQRMVNWHRVGPHPAEILGICPSSRTKSLSWKSLNLWVAYAFDDMSMVNYPFPSNYISDDPNIFLPANPVKVACETLIHGYGNLPESEESEEAELELGSLAWFNSEKKVRALGHAVGVFYNATGDHKCLEPPAEDDTYDGQWDYLWCDTLMPQETYFEIKGPPHDMFLKMPPFDWNAIYKHCMKAWGIVPNPTRITSRFGSVAQMKLGSVSKIIFTNGDLDPWSSGGIKKLMLPFSTSLPVITIKGGAHHVDLMPTHKDDPKEFGEARKKIMEHLRKWLKQSGYLVEEESEVTDQVIEVNDAMF